MQRSLRLSLLIITVAASLAAAQNAPRPLHNADIIKMAANGVPEGTILVTIRNSKSVFDTSTDGLIALSKAGVPASVVEAMIKAGHRASAADPASVTKSATSFTSTDTLGDDFAKLSLRALSAVRGENGKFSSIDGQISVPRRTQETIDEADASARTIREKQIVGALNNLYLAHLSNNMSREMERMKIGVYNAESERRADDAIAHDPRMLQLARQEAACADPLEEQLRARHSAAIPGECTHIQDEDKSASIDPTSMGRTRPDANHAKLSAVVDALGGKAALDAILNYVETTTDGVEMFISFSGYAKMTVVQGQTKQVLSFGAGKNVIVVNGRPTPLPPVIVHEGERIIGLNWLAIAKNFGSPAYQVTSFDLPVSESEKRSGLVIAKGSDHVYWTIDNATNLPVSIRRMGLLPDGTEADVRTTLSDWRRVNGIMVPFKSFTEGAGVPAKSRTTASFLVNVPQPSL